MKAQTPSKKSVPSRAQRIRELLSEGKTPDQIAMLLGVKRQYIYVVKHATKKKAKPPVPVKRKPGRPKGSKTKQKFTPNQRMVETQTQHMGNLIAAYTTTSPLASQGTVITPSIVTVSEPRRTFWQRLKYVFTGA